jgi:two-component system phosphate regulon response regulator PhoB
MQGRPDSDLSRLGRAARVLVADDDPQNRELLEEVCRSEGFEVEGVGSGDRALDAARRRTFDLLLLDAAMPGMDGLEVCRLLKADPETASVPVMIVTASLEDSVRDRATELGAAAFVTKPFRIFELSQRMRATLRRRTRGDDDPPTAPHIRMRRQRADALSALPSPSTLRVRLQKEIETCLKERRPVVCAIIRLENEGELSATVGRSATDALLGSAVMELSGLVEDRVVRGDVDEVVVLIGEHDLPTLATITAQIPHEGRVGAGISLAADISVRWGAKIADPNETDPDQLVAGARSAVEKAQRAGEPGGIDRSPSVSS